MSPSDVSLEYNIKKELGPGGGGGGGAGGEVSEIKIKKGVGRGGGVRIALSNISKYLLQPHPEKKL